MACGVPDAGKTAEVSEMTDNEQKKVLTDILKKATFDSMDEAKTVIRWCLTYASFTSDKFTPFSGFMTLLARKPIEYSGKWGWYDLEWDMLSNKYGAVASYNPKTKKTTFKIHMPPLIKWKG